MSACGLQERVDQLIQKHDGIRPAARVLQIDAGYLSSLASGEKVNPSDFILRRLGLRKLVSYSLIKAAK